MASLLVVAGEASGDLHASHVVRELRARRPDLVIAGMAGDACAAEGMDVRVHCRDVAVMGLTEVIGSLGRIKEAAGTLLRWVDAEKPVAALLVDYAGFNLRLAAELKKRGVRVLYFISPKVWVWGKRRVPTMRALIDRLFVIFPFEVNFFAGHGITAEYVGNPSVDELAHPPARDAARTSLQLHGDAPVVALLPGSRRGEVRRILPLMLSVARAAAQAHPGARFLVPRASTIDSAMLNGPVEQLRAEGVDIRVVEGRAHDVVAASTAAVVASGTAVLETALLGTPQVVVYRAALLTALLVRFTLGLRWVNPVNILMDRAVVPELLQWNATTRKVLRALDGILGGEARAEMERGYDELRRLLGAPGAPGRVAAAVLDVVDGRWTPPAGALPRG